MADSTLVINDVPEGPPPMGRYGSSNETMSSIQDSLDGLAEQQKETSDKAEKLKDSLFDTLEQYMRTLETGSALQDQTGLLSNDRDQLARDNSELTRERNELVIKLNQSEKRNEEVSKIRDDLKSELEITRTRANGAELSVSNLQSMLKEAQTINTELQAHISTAEATIAQQQLNLENTHQHVEELQSDNDKLIKRLGEIDLELKSKSQNTVLADNLNLQLQQSQSQIGQLKLQTEAYGKENERLSQENGSLSARVDTLVQQASVLDNQIKTLTHNLEQSELQRQTAIQTAQQREQTFAQGTNDRIIFMTKENEELTKRIRQLEFDHIQAHKYLNEALANMRIISDRIALLKTGGEMINQPLDQIQSGLNTVRGYVNKVPFVANPPSSNVPYLGTKNISHQLPPSNVLAQAAARYNSVYV